MGDQIPLPKQSGGDDDLLAEKRRKLGETIEKRKQEMGISYRQLADEIGVGHSQIARIIKGGNCNIGTLLKILDGLNLELEIKQTGEKKRKNKGGKGNETDI